MTIDKERCKFPAISNYTRMFLINKSQLAKAESLAYFDKEAKTKIVSDASHMGLGGVLLFSNRMAKRW